jgi:hypothetical protein
VVESSETEGVWFAETLNRFMDVFTSDLTFTKSQESWSTMQETASLIDALRRIREGDPPTSILDIREMRSIEVLEDGPHINKYAIPIRLGDVFEANVNGAAQRYVVLCQPCEIARPKGRPPLIPLAKLVPSSDVKESQRKAGAIYEISHAGENGTPLTVNFKKPNFVPISVLDLAMFTGEGACRFDPRTVCPETLTDGWKKRFNAVKTEMKEFLSLMKLVENSKLNEAGKKKLRKSLGVKYSVGTIQPVVADDTIDFGLRRVHHIREPWASEMLHKFSHFNSRTGLPHDVAGTSEESEASTDGEEVPAM